MEYADRQIKNGHRQCVHAAGCGEIDSVLLVAPNGVHLNWPQRELPEHHWDSIEYDFCAWRTDIAGDMASDEGRRKAWWDHAEELLRSPDLVWFFFASETMTRDDVRKLVQRVYRRRKGAVMAIFDESHDFRTPGSKRSMMARAMARKSKYRRTLTGTALDNSPLHAWAQYELLEKGALGFEKYGDFKQHHAVYETGTTRNGRQFPKLKEYRNLDELQKRMARLSSVVLREDCHDLPELVRITRQVGMTEEQKRLYREVHQTFAVEVGGQEVSLGDENTQKLVKLQQIASGFVRDEWGEDHEVVPDQRNPRLQALLEEVEMTLGKVIIWCNFHSDMDRVAAALRGRGHAIVEYHGRVKDSDKERARKALTPGAQNDIKALVGYPTPGLDLSAAEKIIWYSHTFDAIKRGQADERATAIGGGNVPIVDFVAAPVDDYIISSVREKISVGDSLTRQGIKEVLQKLAL